MFAKCGHCKSRVMMGLTYLDQTFCSEGCVSKYQKALVSKLVPDEVFEQYVQDVFTGPCPECGVPSQNDIYRATTVTGAVVFMTVNTQCRLSCRPCGRRHRLDAALHCLAFGWWAPKAAILNCFILPANLLGAIFIGTATEPSKALRKVARAKMIEPVSPQLLAVRYAEWADGAGVEPDAD